MPCEAGRVELSHMQDDEHVEIEFSIPDHLRCGTYANYANIWYTPTEFTIDFAVVPSVPGIADKDGQQVIEAEISARVKVPLDLIFEIAKAISHSVDDYESEFGPLTPQPDDPVPRSDQ